MGKCKYIFSLLISLLLVNFSFAQDETLYAKKKVKDTLQLKGIKFGFNVGRYSDMLFKPDRKSYEASLDFNLNNKYYGVVEVGYSEISSNKIISSSNTESSLNNSYYYSSEGRFLKLGFDYNMLKKQPSDFLGIGLRLGWSNFSHTADNIVLNMGNWGANTLPNTTDTYNAYWIEASFGVKGEIFKNVYLGWAGIVRAQITGGKDSIFQPIDIPGYGNGSKGLHLAANYYIYYQIPFNRKK